MIVYAIFSVYGEGDSYSAFDLKNIASSIDDAKSYISDLIQDWEWQRDNKRKDLVHDSMTEDNNYTFFGSREECGDCDYCSFGGFVVEQFNVI